MTIFAFTPNTIEHKLKIKEPLDDGDILIYSSSLHSFTNEKASYVLDTTVVVSAVNEGSNNTISIIAYVSSGTIGFKGLKGQNGVNIRVDNNDIIFEINRHEGSTSDTSYSIIFDIDGNENNAVFTVETAVSSSALSLTLPSFPDTIYNNISFHSLSSNSYIYFHENALSSLPFETSMWIKVSSSLDQDGIYKIIDLSAVGSGAKIYLDALFSASTSLSVLQHNIEFSHIVAISEINSSLSIPYNSSKFYTLHIWKPANLSEFYNGKTIKIRNSKNDIIDGFYIIENVSSDSNYFDNKGATLLFDYRSPLPQLSSSPYFILTSSTGNFEIDATGNIISTGFYIEKDGTVHARKIIISSLPSNSFEIANKNYVDNEINSLISTEISSLQNNLSATNTRIDQVDKKLSKTKLFWLTNSHF